MLITVHLKPNSRHREEVVVNDDGSLTVYTKAPAIENRANQALIKILSEYYKVPKTTIEIIRGAKSSTKQIKLQ